MEGRFGPDFFLAPGDLGSSYTFVSTYVVTLGKSLCLSGSVFSSMGSQYPFHRRCCEDKALTDVHRSYSLAKKPIPPRLMAPELS